MQGTTAAGSMRLVLVACLVSAGFAIVVCGLGLVVEPTPAAVLLPFVAAAVSVAGLAIALPQIDQLIQALAQHPATTPHSARTEEAAQTEEAARIRAGSLEQALPDLARVLAENTRAQCAAVWLTVAEKLVRAASYPAAEGTQPHTIANLATLLAQPDVDYVVPVLDGSVLRAALAIGKPGRAVTPADQRLMQDVAHSAGLLLRGAQLNAELEEQVRQADELAAQRLASRQRLARARGVERQRLAAELTQVMTNRLAALRAELAHAQELLSGDAAPAERAQHAVAQARTGLDELLDRFRVLARGVYPAVLRAQGPYSALDELVTDLPRPVRLSGSLSRRCAWEVESGIYWLAASAMQQLAGRPADRPLHVHLGHTEGRLAVRIDDPALAAAANDVIVALTDDIDRLAALGGAVEIAEDGAGGLALRAWLPVQLEPPVDDVTRRRPGPRGSGPMRPGPMGSGQVAP